MKSSLARSVSRSVFALGRGATKLVPERVRKALDDRLFYAIFQLTRVQNDDLVSPEVRARRAGRGATPPTR